MIALIPSITVVRVLRASLITCTIYVVGRFFRRRYPLLPGPRGWPLIGNLFDFPIYVPYKTFGAMRKTYGPIISFKVMGARYVVLNSLKANVDLLGKKSAVTSNRPHFTMGGDLVLSPANWHQEQLQAFYPAEEEEAKQFLRHVLNNPDDLVAHCRRMAGSVILKVSHGYTVKEDNDPLVEMANKAMHNFSVITTPGRFLVDALPALRYLPVWFPGRGFHRDAKRWRDMVSQTADAPHDFALEHLAKGDAAPSFTLRLLQEGVSAEDEEILKWASFSMYMGMSFMRLLEEAEGNHVIPSGGSDTTPSTLSAFFLATTIYPEVLKKAQAEMDAVVGLERLPTMEDREALPYANAPCTELLRWNVVIPLVMHVTTQDQIYQGYLIPKGTCILGNIWFILSDPETYPNPEVFDPERFLGQSPQLDPREACFGWGRQSCPGVHLADLPVFICVAMALATLDVLRCVEDGVEYVPEYDVKEGIVRHVKPFRCRVVPRCKKALELLHAT